LAGLLHVHVVNDATDAPVAGAVVTVGDNPNLDGVTDENGLATFRDATILDGAVDITVTGTDVVPTSWLGVPATNVTIPVVVAGSQPGVPGSGRLNITMADLGSLSPSDGADYFIVGANSSSLRDLGDPANDIDAAGVPRCTTHPLDVATPCSSGFELRVRSGTLAVLATILQVENNGTPANVADDVIVGVRAYAAARSVVVTQGSTQPLTLNLLDDNDLIDVTVDFPALAPAGLGENAALAALDLGDTEGVLFFESTFFSLDADTQRVPAAAGVFADAAGTLVAGIATEGGNNPLRRTITVRRDPDLESTVVLPDWMAPADHLSVTGSTALTISHDAIAGASLRTLELRANVAGQQGRLLWSIVALDERSAITLPALSTDPIPTGTNLLEVNGIDVPGFDAASFTAVAVRETLARLGTAEDTFSH
jgi:hypothetical protein